MQETFSVLHKEPKMSSLSRPWPLRVDVEEEKSQAVQWKSYPINQGFSRLICPFDSSPLLTVETDLLTKKRF